MFCPRCGSDIPEKARFCTECGLDLSEVRLLFLKVRDPAQTQSETGALTPPCMETPEPSEKADPGIPCIRKTTPLPEISEETHPPRQAAVRQFPEAQETRGPASPPPQVKGISNPAAESTGPVNPTRIRNPTRALMLSIIPGLGQVYNGMLIPGIVLFVATLFGLLLLILPGICIWSYSAFHAYRLSKKINSGEIPFCPRNKKRYIFFALNPLVIIFLMLVVTAGLSGNTSTADVSIPAPYSLPLSHGTETSQSFWYTLRGADRSISYPFYSGVNDYFASVSAPEANLSQGGEHLDFVNNYRQEKYLRDFVASIRSSAASPDDQARIAVSLVQHIPYDSSKAEMNDAGRWFNSYYPYEVLYNNRGKCDEKSHLLAFLLKELGFGTVIFEFPGEKHSAVGIKSPDAYAFRNTGYAYIESTSPSIITDTSIQAGSMKIRDFSNPVVIKISDGSAMTSLGEEFADARKKSETPAWTRYPVSGIAAGISSAISSLYSSPYFSVRQTYQPLYTTGYNPDYTAIAEKYGIEYRTSSDSRISSPADISGNQARYAALVRVQEQLALKDYAAALGTINEALSKKPGDTGLLLTKSAIQTVMGSHSSSLTTLEQVLSHDPGNPLAYYVRAQNYQALNDYHAALESYNKSIQIYPQYLNALWSRGLLLAKQKKYDDALRSYDQALVINPDFAAAWAGKGDVLISTGRKTEAMEAYQNALSAEPDLPEVWVALGNLYAGMGQCGEAKTCYSKATAIDKIPRSPLCMILPFVAVFGIGSIVGIFLWAYALSLFLKRK